MGCFSSKHTMTVTTTTGESTSATHGDFTYTDVSETTYTQGSRGQPTTKRTTYRTVTYEPDNVAATPSALKINEGLWPRTPLDTYIEPTFALDLLRRMRFFVELHTGLRAQDPKRPSDPIFANGYVTVDNVLPKLPAYPVIKIGTLIRPLKPKGLLGKQEVDASKPPRWRWAWADVASGGEGEKWDDEEIARGDGVDIMAIKRAGEEFGIPELSTPEITLDPAMENLLILAAASRALGLPVAWPEVVDPKRPAPESWYLLRTDLPDFPSPPRKDLALREPRLMEIDSDTYCTLRSAGRIHDAGELKRHGAGGPACLSGLAEKMGWECYDLGSRGHAHLGVEAIGMRDPKTGCEWAARTEYSVSDGVRHNKLKLTIRQGGYSAEYTRAFNEH